MSLPFLALQSAMLLVPGWLITSLLQVHRARLLFVVMFSYLVFIAAVFIGRRLEVNPDYLLLLWGAIVVCLVGAALFARRRVRHSETVWIQYAFGSVSWRVVTLAIVAMYVVYQILAGVYAEIPADLYRHLEFVKREFVNIESGGLGNPRAVEKLLLHQAGKYWYTLVALNAYLSGESATGFFSAAMWLNGLLFCLGLLSFSRYLFERYSLPEVSLVTASFLAVFFTAVHMGIHAFSYLRYYSLAPSMLNFLCYFGGIVCLLAIVDRERRWFINLILLLGCTVVAALIHTQEAMFIWVIALLLALWLPGRHIVTHFTRGLGAFWIQLVFLAIVVICIGAAFWVLHHRLEFRPPLGSRLMYLPWALPILTEPLILKPGYQFTHVLTYWGFFIYALFLIHIRQFLTKPFLLVGMVSPLFTVFNPVFVDLFLRADNSSTLWRLCYLVPIHFVAAYLLVKICGDLRSGSLLKKAYGVVVCVFSMLLLLPSLGNVEINPYARTTLAAIPEQNSHHHWLDLVDYLNELSAKEIILVDPVTGYVISALTPHKTFRHKFLRDSQYHNNRFEFDSYADDPLKKYTGRLLVINLRNGGHSVTGERARHWPQHVLRVSDFYSDNLLSYIDSRPARLSLIWQAEDIRVFRVN
ncbi:MAG: hypothetical protein AAF402_06555 [Pseudomonadota bacterium]